MTVVLGETGSGKSTQLAKYLLDAKFGRVACVQPRKLAALSLANYVGKRVNSVGCDLWADNPRPGKLKDVIFTTGHTLLMRWAEDRSLSAFGCVIVDEAHERTLTTDLLVAVLKQTLEIRPHLRVVITSATIDPKIFIDYFRPLKATVVKVPGKIFPIQTIYDPQPFDINGDYVKRAVDKVEKIVSDKKKNVDGDILVFLATPADTERALKLMQGRQKLLGLTVLQLHGKLQPEQQQKVFQATTRTKVVLATNIAETSLTVPGVTVVVDSGIVKERQLDPRRHAGVLALARISKSSARQRMGRAGRTAPGRCFRLYRLEDHSRFEEFTQPEIKRLPLDLCLLTLFKLGMENPGKFDFLESPSFDAIHEGLSSLKLLEAIQKSDTEKDSYSLTKLGRKMSSFTMDPRLSRLLICVGEDSQHCSPEVLSNVVAICAMVSTGGNIFFRAGTDEQKEAADINKVSTLFHTRRSHIVHQ